jgi:hypothetical protein
MHLLPIFLERVFCAAWSVYLFLSHTRTICSNGLSLLTAFLSLSLALGWCYTGD